MDKQRQDLRKSLRNQRKSLSNTAQSQHAALIARQLSKHSLFKRSKRIAIYLPTDGEIDPTVLIYKAWRSNKKIYLPVLAPFSNRLYFAPYNNNCKMKLNRFLIAEPDIHPKHWLKPRQMNLILTPLVGFDSMGNRLGMGGGFYDRSLSFTRFRKTGHAPYLIGLAHQLQCVKHLSQQAHDIPMKIIATEQRLYEIFPA
ncbi:5-formyltetrahydrofolate cyclo-ligase [hydrothermal vent metagenome]|uniref:5-formyltetrahydrofolate cyclo-ligase n=1 Tax=hydrothermal vent metagenome TaxID=652676 RepID=A0A3B0XZT6_9ZZZZ